MSLAPGERKDILRAWNKRSNPSGFEITEDDATGDVMITNSLNNKFRVYTGVTMSADIIEDIDSGVFD